MSTKQPKQITVNMQPKDVVKNLVDIVNTMEGLRLESLRNFFASDEIKLEYLRLSSELAGCIQDVIKDNGVEKYISKINSFMDDSLLLYYDPMQKEFWNEIEPTFPKIITDLSMVTLRDDYTSQGQDHHLFQGLKYLTTPNETKEETYLSIQPFNNLLSEELITNPKVAKYVMEKMLLGFIEQNKEGFGMSLQNTQLDNPEFIKQLEKIGALYVDVPYKTLTKMKKTFPNSTTIGEGKEKKARILFTPQNNNHKKNMFELFSSHAKKKLESEKNLSTSAKNIYSFGKTFLKDMQKEIGITNNEKNKNINIIRNQGKSIIEKNDNNFLITNLNLYNPDGSIALEYPEIYIEATSNETRKTQEDWIKHYKETNNFLPSLPLYYAILEATYDNKNEKDAKELIENLKLDLKPNWLVTSTRFDYKNNKVWHNYSYDEQIELDINIPGIEEYLENLVVKSNWEKPLKSIFMTENVNKISELLGGLYKNRKGYLWTPTGNREIQRAGFLYFNGNSDFHFDGDYSLNILGRSRGVGTGGSK